MKKRNKKQTRIRISNKPRFILFCLLSILTLTTSIGSLTSAQATKNQQSYALCISSGDTLWEIAASANTNDKDLRRVIDDIMKLNNMRDTSLKVGDTIEIPIY